MEAESNESQGNGSTGKVGSSSMNTDNVFRKWSKSSIPDGKYTISLQFSGRARKGYDLEVASGVCTAIVPLDSPNGLSILERCQLNYLDVEPSKSGEAHFEIAGILPDLLPPQASEIYPLSNMKGFSVVKIEEEFGFLVNEHPYLKKDGVTEWCNFENFLIDWVIIRLGEKWLRREFHKREHDRPPFVRMFQIFRHRMDAYVAENRGGLPQTACCIGL